MKFPAGSSEAQSNRKSNNRKFPLYSKPCVGSCMLKIRCLLSLIILGQIGRKAPTSLLLKFFFTNSCLREILTKQPIFHTRRGRGGPSCQSHILRNILVSDEMLVQYEKPVMSDQRNLNETLQSLPFHVLLAFAEELPL